MKLLLTFVLTISANFISAQSITNIGLSEPPDSILLFGEGTISTFMNERDFAISPDGKEIYFTVSTPKSSMQTIVSCRRLKNDEWSYPEVVSFAGPFNDLEPAFSHDGKTLYFASNRPLEGDKPKDYDIWRVSRIASGWTNPENIGLPVNTSADEFYPSVTKSGNLYFTAMYPEGPGKEDIYVATLKNNSWQKPVAMDSVVNTKFYEFNAFVSPDEDFLLFTSFGRTDDTGRGDVYISEKDFQGKWKLAVNLKEINSPFLDYCPYVSPDKKILFVTSERHQLPTSIKKERLSYKEMSDTWLNPLNGNGNIYWVDFQKILPGQK